MKLLWSNLSLGGLYTYANDDDDANTNATDNDNDTWQTEHDCIGSLPNEPKSATSIPPWRSQNSQTSSAKQRLICITSGMNTVMERKQLIHFLKPIHNLYIYSQLVYMNQHLINVVF